MRGKAKSPDHRAAISVAKRAAFEARILADAQLLYGTALRLGKDRIVGEELQGPTGLSTARLVSVMKRLQRARETNQTLEQVLAAERKVLKQDDSA